MSPSPPARKPGFFSRIWALVPFSAWLLLAAIIGGIAGLGAFTFAYAQGASYLSDEPSACVNCHVMRDVYDGWNHGSHKAIAVCNDCHTPHSSVVAKYAVKGLNGFRHSAAFTLGNFPEPINITSLNRNVAQNNCLSCHEAITAEMNHTLSDEPTDCLHCHARVGHMK
ncbi:MAG: cytochrome c nitrite reductase small subunit [Chloroflexota bacterium]|jgi:cytochrome c nitrite reductase small subunit